MGGEVATIGVEMAYGATRLVAVARWGDGVRRAATRLSNVPIGEQAAQAIVALVSRLRSDAHEAGAPAFTSLAIAHWDDLNVRGGVVVRARHTAGWERYPLAASVTAGVGLPARLVPAWQATALALAHGPNVPRYDDALYVQLGRGVWATYVAGGRIVAGGGDTAGQLGHVGVSPDGPRCSCGGRGHVEPLASAQSLVRTFIGRASGSDEATAAMLRASAGRAEAMSAAQVVALADDGDETAQGIVEEAALALGVALAGPVAVLAPGRIVLLGLGGAADASLGRRVSVVLGGALGPAISPPPIVAGAPDAWAAATGAALYAED